MISRTLEAEESEDTTVPNGETLLDKSFDFHMTLLGIVVLALLFQPD